jgi:formylglycine-generating enzyme
MLLRVTPQAVTVLAFWALCGCSRVLGSDGLDYTLDESVFDGCTGSHGPVPVQVDGQFCIDGTEVTNAQYLEFVEAQPDFEQPVACAWNQELGSLDALLPRGEWPPGATILDRPVNNVDWCDAWSYCHWAGKRLCGRVGGAAPDFDDFNSTRSELYYACSHKGERAYPYGDEFVREACPGLDYTQPQPVASFPGCEGGYPGLFDMSGNVTEWNGLCRDAAGATDSCRTGPEGVAAHPLPLENFACAWGNYVARNTFNPDLGIRCCSDAR